MNGNPFYVQPGSDFSQGLSGLGNTIEQYGKERKAKERFSKVKEALTQAWASNDSDKIAQVMIEYPEARQTMEVLIPFRDKESKEQGLKTYRQALSLKDNPQEAINALQSRIEYLDGRGIDSTHTKRDLEALQRISSNNGDTAPVFAQMENAYSALASPQEWESYKVQSGYGLGGKSTPNSVKETVWFLKQSPEVQKKHLELKRKSDPTLAEKLQFELDKERGTLGVQAEAATDKKFKEQLGVEGSKVYTQLQNAAREASAFIPRLKSLRDLASKVETGTGAEVKMAAKKALGIDSADMEELNAKLGELAQDILNQQTGTKTDFDFQNAVRQAASLGKTKEANGRLISALIDRQLEAVNFGDMAKDAYDQGGVKGVLDMRFSSGEAPSNDKQLTPTGRTATNPKTGAKMQEMSDGSWSPM